MLETIWQCYLQPILFRMYEQNLELDNLQGFICSRLFPDEQKECYKRTRESGDLQYVDQQILKEIKTRQKNVMITWISNKKAKDMVPQTWIMECVKIYKI